jgi:hypothetical protein
MWTDNIRWECGGSARAVARAAEWRAPRAGDLARLYALEHGQVVAKEAGREEVGVVTTGRFKERGPPDTEALVEDLLS